jgi:glycosyltransferase involved in cell wall biosynthesis
MIVRDEEQVLSRCLKSVEDIVDEIIIVDTGSKDKTKEIASKFTPFIYDFQWIDDFSAARNYSFSKATKDYILWLDADDVLLADDGLELKKLKQTLGYDIDVVKMKYNLWVDENNNIISGIYRERLLKREKNFKWQDPIHEHVDIYGKIIKSNISITHKKIGENSCRNLNIFEKIIGEGRKLTPRNIIYYARELFNNDKYDDAIVYFNKFLNIGNQPVSQYLDACIGLSKCYKTKKDDKNAVRALLKSFEYDIPNAYTCALLGSYYKSMKEYTRAIFWLELTLKLEKPEDIFGSMIDEFLGYYPCKYLAQCYHEIGNIYKEEQYRKKAKDFKKSIF